MTSSTVFTTYKAGHKIHVTLYGDVTPERLKQEQAIAAHRAEQLYGQPKVILWPMDEDV